MAALVGISEAPAEKLVVRAETPAEMEAVLAGMVELAGTEDMVDTAGMADTRIHAQGDTVEDISPPELPHKYIQKPLLKREHSILYSPYFE